jgi:hypothetical protein
MKQWSQLTLSSAFVVLFASLTLVACSNSSDVAATRTSQPVKALINNSVIVSTESIRTTTPTPEYSKKRELAKSPTPTYIVLDAPPQAEKEKLDAKNSGRDLPCGSVIGPMVHDGFKRNLNQTADVERTAKLLNWKTTPTQSHIAAINIKSIGAKTTHLGLLIKQMPDSAVLRVYANDDTHTYDMTGLEVKQQLARTIAYDGFSNGITTVIAPKRADNITVEIELPPNFDPVNFEMAIPFVTHSFFLTDALSSEEAKPITPAVLTPGVTGPSLSCQIDVKCQTTLPPISDAVVWLEFDGGKCSGTFVRDSLNSDKAYIITAAHCIRDQTVANSLRTTWFYRSMGCFSGQTTRFKHEIKGATLLTTVEATDSSLLLLPYPAPFGSVSAAWDSQHSYQYWDAIGAVHHPQGDSQKISAGNATGFFNQVGKIGLGGNLWSSWTSDSTHISTNLLVEPGSSGSGLFKNINNSNSKFIGVTSAIPYGSNRTCSGEYTAFIGRFDKSYAAGMSDWLNPNGIKSVNRFYNNSTGTHFYTISSSEKTLIETNWPTIFTFEGAPFKASASPSAGLTPVHRYYNTNTNAHFFTINDGERAYVAATLPQFRYEGVAWHANTQAAAGTTPLHRFYNTATGTHFYTVSEAEKASVVANLPQFNYEGVAYYVQP